MTRDSIRAAGLVLQDLLHHPLASELAGRSVAVFTNWGFGLFAVLAVVAFSDSPGRRRKVGSTALVGVTAGCLASTLGTLLKHLVGERRPCQVDPSAARWTVCQAPGNWSFPSNHSVWAGALAVTVLALAILAGRRWIAVAGCVVALSIATSRVVLGVHHWWDAVAGLVLGALVTTGGLRLGRSARARCQRKRRNNRQRASRVIA